MMKNMGGADRVIRVVAALAVAALYFAGILKGTVAIVLGAFAVIFLLTSAIGFCPLYVPLGLNTGAKGTGTPPKM